MEVPNGSPLLLPFPLSKQYDLYPLHTSQLPSSFNVQARKGEIYPSEIRQVTGLSGDKSDQALVFPLDPNGDCAVEFCPGEDSYYES